MTAKPEKARRCAIYTRKSTEHGLELEFNSLDAQREACEAYIKSQSQEGWSTLSQRYDDAAFSGGNLKRPALQNLLNDIDAGQVNVVVVYKIDRLTRSLADFAKLVERFDAKGVSFVAVTQQFNTTTSMGRLTLNVLLSFAQFERELSSERVRDKVAASRQKGKWTGGGVPLGYEVKDKKLVLDAEEADTVRLIFQRYLALKCLRRLKADLDDRGIVSKRRTNRADRTVSGGVPMTHGPLAYLLKNRTYLGEIGHKGTWFPGEHQAIVDPALFNAVQELLKTNSIARHRQRCEHPSLLKGLLCDDRGDRMSPSFTTKRGVRYRFYVNNALLKGRTEQIGSITRVAAMDLEQRVVAAVRDRCSNAGGQSDKELVNEHIERVTLSRDNVLILLKTSDKGASQIELARSQIRRAAGAKIETDTKAPNASLPYALTRAHCWSNGLCNGTYRSVEELAAIVKWNPKVIRKVLRLAFLAPDIIEAIMHGTQPTSLNVSELQGIAAYSWDKQRRLSGFPERNCL
jgi:DNA invertase Pin-like site-specific DNA recombinase